MPGDEQKSTNRTENHARSAIISSTISPILNPYMSYKCVHMKFGVMLYRKGGDP